MSYLRKISVRLFHHFKYRLSNTQKGICLILAASLIVIAAQSVIQLVVDNQYTFGIIIGIIIFASGIYIYFKRQGGVKNNHKPYDLKDKNNTTVVNQIMAFGGLLKVNIVNNNKIRAFMAPGFGMAMLKDASVNAAGKKSDENLISPTFKMGVQYKFNSNILVGIERMLVTNWLNDSINTLGYPTEYTSVAATYEF